MTTSSTTNNTTTDTNLNSLLDKFLFDDKIKVALLEKMDEMLNYTPTIGVFGKTGVGKSSLCNALFGEDICKIDDVKACTRDPQKVILETGGSKNITLLDVPGVGESNERDLEYEKLYSKLLPELDIVLWVLKADERAYSVDQDFYFNVVKPHLDQGKPFFFVLNQVDAIQPFREWDLEAAKPSENQQKNIEEKQINIASIFKVSRDEIIPVSANEKYNLSRLVERVVYKLPNDKKISFVKNVEREHISKKTREEAKGGFVSALKGAAKGAAIGRAIGGPVGAAIGGIVGGIGGFLGLW